MKKRGGKAKCLFCDFAQGISQKHRNGHSFSKLKETKNTLSFLSLDSPINHDAHILVIPKNHYENFHEVPNNIKHELSEHISLIGSFIKKRHEGYNILLNNGKAAGQYVEHCHFHLIPRDLNDKIKIEIWRRKRISKNKFEDLARRTKKQLESNF
ncbi:MAG: HIT family protein [Nanoarchaeota archaeon]|nr:HIT family protein [Nanoarchaeota archaeon]